MLYLKVRRSGPIRGDISMPPSKTHSFRALILASLADGVVQKLMTPELMF